MVTHDKLMLAVRGALLGAVSASLRAVACGWTGERITLRFVFDGPITEEDEEDMRVVGTGVVANFPAPLAIAEEIVRVDHPEPLGPYGLQAWAFRRKERTVT